MNVPPSELAPFFITRFISVASSISNAVKLVGASPNRVALLISAPSGAGISIWPDSTAASTKGIQLTTTIPFILLRYKDIGPLVCGEWWLGTTTGAINIAILETLFGQNMPPTDLE